MGHGRIVEKNMETPETGPQQLDLLILADAKGLRGACKTTSLSRRMDRWILISIL